jgi:hypothetical protein
MQEKSEAYLESLCLAACRRRPGCTHLQRVVIGRIKPLGSGPNWEGNKEGKRTVNVPDG